MDIVLATSNKHKIEEFNQMGKYYNLHFLSLEDINFNQEVIEDGKTFAENSLIKARAVSSFTSLPVLSDDSGIIIQALGNNVPGVYSHRYADENGGQEALNQKLSSTVAGSYAYFSCVLTYINKCEVHQFEGIMEGKISSKVQNKNGFGYDPIFIPKGYDEPISTLSPKEKNEISHRSLAFKKFVNFIFSANV